MKEWPFDQGPRVVCVTTINVLNGSPILQVCHYEDDDSWGFTCGKTSKTEDGRVVGMGEILKIDPSLETIADLPPGWSASRQSVDSPWDRYPTPVGEA